ncbi:hypothetical protein BH10PSE12_BH10PSE12_08660 [soil metagenome]
MPRSVIKPVLGFLRAILLGPETTEGFGQSMADDIRFVLRFRRCRRITVNWHAPSEEEAKAIEADALLGRFGDVTIAVADVAGRRWTVRERDWHGWPDPPKYVFFAQNEDRSVWAARDFDQWPGAWPVMP